jgi:hypothetical protein
MYTTSFLVSLGRDVSMLAAIKHCCNEYSDEPEYWTHDMLLDKHMQRVFYGDDHVVSISDALAQYVNMPRVAAANKVTNGSNYTAPDKTTEFPDYYDITQVSFISRKFVERDGRVYAPLPLETVRESICWCNHPDRYMQTLGESLQSFRIELNHFPLEIQKRELAVVRMALMAHPETQHLVKLVD